MGIFKKNLTKKLKVLADKLYGAAHDDGINACMANEKKYVQFAAENKSIMASINSKLVDIMELARDVRNLANKIKEPKK